MFVWKHECVHWYRHACVYVCVWCNNAKVRCREQRQRRRDDVMNVNSLNPPSSPSATHWNACFNLDIVLASTGRKLKLKWLSLVVYWHPHICSVLARLPLSLQHRPSSSVVPLLFVVLYVSPTHIQAHINTNGLYASWTNLSILPSASTQFVAPVCFFVCAHSRYLCGHKQASICVSLLYIPSTVPYSLTHAKLPALILQLPFESYQHWTV